MCRGGESQIGWSRKGRSFSAPVALALRHMEFSAKASINFALQPRPFLLCVSARTLCHILDASQLINWYIAYCINYR